MTPGRTTKRVALHSLGCKLNYAETATIGRQFTDAGYEIVPFGDSTDVVVLNTCSVTDRADRECRQLVRRAHRTSPGAFVAVVGCYAQLQPDEIAEIPGVNLVAGTSEKFRLLELMLAAQPDQAVQAVRRESSGAMIATVASSLGSDRTRGFLKIQDGCDYSCAFCTIPKARGASRSVDATHALLGARELVAAGYREIVLTGVNTGDYGTIAYGSLRELLGKMISIEGLESIRISSIEPNLLDDDLLQFWLESPKLCRHWHMPLQSGSNEILGKMRRRYRTEWYANRVERIKAADPDAGIGLDVIAGFPGETDKHFAETESLIKELPISYLHVFPYSVRPGTEAAGLPGHVEPRVRFERAERLRVLGERKRHVFHGRFVGREVGVLFEGRDDQNQWVGLTGNYARVLCRSEKELANIRTNVTVTDADHHACLGKPTTIAESAHAA